MPNCPMCRRKTDPPPNRRQQAFKQIAIKNNVKGDDAGIREITRQFDFLLIEQRERLTDRAYVFINAIEQNAQLFLENLATALDIDLPPAEPAKLSQMKISFEPMETSQKNFEPLVEYLHSQRSDSDACKKLVSTVQSVSLLVAEQNKKKENAALDFATQAEKRLAAIDMQTAGPETYEELKLCLERCTQVVGAAPGLIQLPTQDCPISKPAKIQHRQ